MKTCWDKSPRHAPKQRTTSHTRYTNLPLGLVVAGLLRQIFIVFNRVDHCKMCWLIYPCYLPLTTYNVHRVLMMYAKAEKNIRIYQNAYSSSSGWQPESMGLLLSFCVYWYHCYICILIIILIIIFTERTKIWIWICTKCTQWNRLTRIILSFGMPLLILIQSVNSVVDTSNTFFFTESATR